ncbi:hypothetical protein U9W97_004169 [Enterobacter bugandensis]
MVLTFKEAVFGLQMIHDSLWFYVGSVFEGSTDLYPDLWQSSTIRSAGGRILAFQVGGADDWSLSVWHQIPDGPMDFPDEDTNKELLTSNFLKNAQYFIDRDRFFTEPD